MDRSLSLSAFQRHAGKYLAELAASGGAMSLSLRGRGRVVVTEAEAWDRLQARLARSEVQVVLLRALLARAEGRTVDSAGAFDALGQE